MWSFVGTRRQPPLAVACPSITTQARCWPMSLAAVKTKSFCRSKRCWSPLGSHSFIRSLGGVRTTSRTRHAESGQTEHPETRAQASDVTNADQPLRPSSKLLLAIDPDARHRHWLVRQSVRLWTVCLKWSSPHREHYPWIEGAWASRSPAKVSRPLPLRLAKLPKPIQDIRWKAQGRLCRRYRHLSARGKHPHQVGVRDCPRTERVSVGHGPAGSSKALDTEPSWPSTTPCQGFKSPSEEGQPR